MQQYLIAKKIIINNYSFFSSDKFTLLPSDVVVCLAIFLTCSSHKEWHKLDLEWCFIQDQGFQILHRELTRYNLTITKLDLSDNGLTESCSLLSMASSTAIE